MSKYTVESITLGSGPAVAIRGVVPVTELPQFFSDAFSELAAAIADSGARPTGAPFARFFSFGPAAIDVEAAFPISREIPAAGRVYATTLDGGEAVQVCHVGRYDQMGSAYVAIESWLADHHLRANGPPREVYMSDPEREPDPAKQVTLVQQLVASAA